MKNYAKSGQRYIPSKRKRKKQRDQKLSGFKDKRQSGKGMTGFSVSQGTPAAGRGIAIAPPATGNQPPCVVANVPGGTG